MLEPLVVCDCQLKSWLAISRMESNLLALAVVMANAASVGAIFVVIAVAIVVLEVFVLSL